MRYRKVGFSTVEKRDPVGRTLEEVVRGRGSTGGSGGVRVVTTGLRGILTTGEGREERPRVRPGRNLHGRGRPVGGCREDQMRCPSIVAVPVVSVVVVLRVWDRTRSTRGLEDGGWSVAVRESGADGWS